jgi:DNA-binding transcriptional LysR family regulator
MSLLPLYCIGDQFETGKLVEVLSGYQVAPPGVFVLSRYSRFLLSTIRAFSDCLVERLSASGRATGASPAAP